MIPPVPLRRDLPVLPPVFKLFGDFFLDSSRI